MSTPDYYQRASDPERLAALERSGLLERTEDERLTVLCETAAHLVKAPAALLNIITGSEQITIAGWPTGQENKPVADTPCYDVVVTREVLSIPNTLLHPVVCNMPFVVVGGFRSYLGVPIFHDDQVLGSFCVVDVKVREWGYWDIQALKGVARLAGLAVEGEK